MAVFEFPPVSRAQWQAQAQKDLKGRPLARLTKSTADGVAISPLYSRDDLPADAGLHARPGQFPGLRGRTPTGAGRGQGWLSVQDYRDADAGAANAAARRDLERGADGLRFVLDSGIRAGRGPSSAADGLVCDPMTELDTLLAGIDPRRTLVLFEAGLAAPLWADAYENWLDDHADDDGEGGEGGESGESGAGGGREAVELGRGPSEGGVIYDPFAPLLATGGLELDFEGALARQVDRILGMRSGMLGVSTAPYHDAGAGEAEELALALASCAELLRRGAGLGLEIEDLCGAMIWTLPVAGRPFEAIAKLRAARLLWAKFSAAAGSPDTSLWIHATSSGRSWTRHGPWVNLLRGTVGSFAAALGGADSVATAAFDGLCGPEGAGTRVDGGLGRGSELGRRLALNTQVILREESHLDRVVDPAGGSYYVEALTDALARTAWARFREIEGAGGIVAGLVAGAIHASIAASAERLRERAATRREPLTGLSTFPVLDDQPTPEQSANHHASEGPELQRTGPTLEPAEVPALTPVRVAGAYERLRDASESWAAAQGARPQIWACTLGPLPRHQARADFARNGFAAGGLELVGAAPLTEQDPEALAAAARAALEQSGASLAVVCAHDEDYARFAAALVVALRAGGAREVWIAGRPPDEHAWGLDPELPPRFVYRGCDLVTELEHALGSLGVTTDEEQG